MRDRGVCVVGGLYMAGGERACHRRYYGIRSMSGRYASYWNAFLSYLCLSLCQAVKTHH